MPPLSDRPQRILVLRTDRLGELLLTLPAVTALREMSPEAHITLVVQEPYAALMRCAPAVQDVIAVPWMGRRIRWRDTWPLVRQLRRGRFDVALIANPHKWLHWAVWQAGVPRRIGYDHKWSWCLTDRLPDVKTHHERHEVEWNLDLLKPLGVVANRPDVSLPIPEPLTHALRARLHAQGVSWETPVIALHPWASTLEKRWPLSAFRALATTMRAEGYGPMTVIGGTEHAEEAQAFCRGLPGITNLVGTLTLVELAAYLSQCALLISNDSGPAHVAAAVGTPTVTLFGRPHPWEGPIRWRPWGDGHVVLHRVPITNIRVEDVMSAVRQQCHACAH